MIAQSRTERAIGPAWSRLEANAIVPQREQLLLPAQEQAGLEAPDVQERPAANHRRRAQEPEDRMAGQIRHAMIRPPP